LILSTALLLNWFYQKTKIEACRETARRLDLDVRNAITGGAATSERWQCLDRRVCDHSVAALEEA